jgi:hypothetical protein
MNFSMPKYECKFNDKETWEDVSESELLRDLQVYYGNVTPAIQQIIKGKYVRTSKGVYRLKMKE